MSETASSISSKKKCAVITAASSSAGMFVPQFIAKGLEVVVTVPVQPDTDTKAILERMRKVPRYQGADVFFDYGDIEPLIEYLDRYDVAYVVPGGDPGVVLADQLAAHYGLRGNDPSTTWRRHEKYGMHQSLKENGLRYMETRKVHCEGDIHSFWTEKGCDAAVMKFSESAASYGVKICRSLEESIDHYHHMQTLHGLTGGEHSDILIQEFIDGDQYVVNTVSREGTHMVTEVLRCPRVVVDGASLYFSGTLIMEITAEIQPLVDYALKVLDAVDFKNGICHSEYLIDSKGPILIETNPRAMGGLLDTDITKRSLGRTYLEFLLTAYDDPETFERIRHTYPAKTPMFQPSYYITAPIHGDLSPFSTLTIYMTGNAIDQERCDRGIFDWPKSTDLITSFDARYNARSVEEGESMLYLTQNVFEKYPLLFFESEPIKGIDNERTMVPGIFVTNNSSNIIFKGYNNCLFDVTKSEWLHERYLSLFKLHEGLSEGGIMTITRESCSTFPYGTEGVMMLCRLMCMEPSLDDDGNVVAIKGPSVYIK